ncbi:unnamed protein product, partial [Urochloa humidicola]
VKEEFITCVFCSTKISSGILRFKQHLAGGYGDAVKCPRAPEPVRNEMHAYSFISKSASLDSGCIKFHNRLADCKTLE